MTASTDLGEAVFDALGYEPTPRQREFHDATGQYRGWTAKAGAGKTLAMLAESIRACVEHPEITVAVFRRTDRELKDSVLPAFRTLGFAAALGAVYIPARREATFPNGSRLRFLGAFNVRDAITRFTGAEWQFAAFDDENTIDAETRAFLRTRLKSTAGLPVLGTIANDRPPR